MRTKVRGLHIIFHHILKDLLAQMLTILSSNNLQQGVLAGLVWIPVRLIVHDIGVIRLKMYS